MALIKRFEDIRAWQEARTLTKGIYTISDKGIFGKDYGLRDQIRRASVSSMSNIAEEFDCDSPKEFARFLGFARRSTVEVQSQLYIALDAGYISQQIFDQHYAQAKKTKALIGAFLHSVKKRIR